MVGDWVLVNGGVLSLGFDQFHTALTQIGNGRSKACGIFREETAHERAHRFAKFNYTVDRRWNGIGRGMTLDMGCNFQCPNG